MHLTNIVYSSLICNFASERSESVSYNGLKCRSFRIADKSRENSNIIEVESDVKIYYNQLIITRKFKLERI